MIESKKTEWELVEDKYIPESWRVEGIDYGNEGIIYVAIFTGSKCKELAEEYYSWKTQKIQYLTSISTSSTHV